MSGGFADRSGYSGACHAVLSRGDPIRERLARHLRPRLPHLLFCGKEGERGGEDGPAESRRLDPSSTQALPPQPHGNIFSVPALGPPCRSQ